MVDCRSLIVDLQTLHSWFCNQQSTITKSTISLSPGPKPCPKLRQPVRRRCGYREFPTSPCRRGFHPARCGTACGSWCRPRAALRTVVAAHAAPPPKCSGSCCQSLRSTSLRLSLDNQFLQFHESRASVVECRSIRPAEQAICRACPTSRNDTAKLTLVPKPGGY